MKVLIAGGTGLIGKALALALTESGNQVWVLSRSPERAQMTARVQVTAWDGKSPQGWGQLINEMDAIINLAGASIGTQRWTENRKDEIRESRLNAGQAIVDAVKMASKVPRLLVQASAVGYYGTSSDLPLDEVSPAGSDFLSKICVEWEASTRPVEELGVRRVVIRTGVVLDRHEGALARILLPFYLFAGGPLGSGRQWLPWIHIKDEVDAIRFLMADETASGVFNLTAPQPLINADFGKKIARVLKRPYWLPAPAFVLRFLLGEMSLLVLEGQRPLPRRLEAASYQFQYEEAEKALRDLLK